MENLLNKPEDVLARSSSELGVTTLEEHKIETRDVTPVKRLLRRFPNSLRTVVEDQVQNMLENNTIKPSISPWSSPIVFCSKERRTWRFRIAFRKLYDVTAKGTFLCTFSVC